MVADGSIEFQVELDNKKAITELNQVEKRIKELERSLEETRAERDKADEKSIFDAAVLDAEKMKLQEIRDRLADIRALSKDKSLPTADRTEYADQIPAAKEELADQQQRVNALQRDYDKIIRSVDRYDEKLKAAATDLDRQKERAGELTLELSKTHSAGAKLRESVKTIDAYMARFTGRLKKLALNALVITAFSSALRGLRKWLWNSIKANDQARAAINKLKGALLTLVQPLLNVVIPAFTSLVNLLTRVVSSLAHTTASLFGTTAEASAKAAESLYQEQQALAGVGKTAGKASKSLAGFDEINQLHDSSGSAGGAESSSAPDFSGVVNDGLSAVTSLFTGIALLSLGAVLTFTGANIPIGLGLMVLGAVATYQSIRSDPNLATRLVESGLANLLGILGAASLALGAVLVFTGAAIPLGISLLILGAAELVGWAAVSWDAITQALEGQLGAVTAILSGAILVLGAVLTFTGASIPLGLGLIVAGGAGLAAAIIPNRDAVVTALQGPLGKILAIVGSALLALGLILVFTGAGIPLGLGMILAGGAGMALAIIPNWNAIVTALQGPLGKILAIVGSALLVLGLILVFTGVGIPLGLGLIIAGGASLAAAIIPNWGFILDKIKGAWASIKAFWNKHIAPVFTAKWWGDLAKKAMNGLITGIENAINFILNGFGNFINWITSALNKIPGVDIGRVDWGHVQLPRLASGAVIPPNKEFLAVLGDQKQGTNIETPLATMLAAFKQALAESGYGGNNEATLVLDRETLGKVVWKLNKAEERRIGVSLAGV